ncbi:uncharacterized protein LOC122526094 isoform X1 [Polistes fuscatus]|uniref:uncharacterized protein LOC122526094 isoform X1 n=1 Tax=Polistes fuscatus TaxID=30207 RepID=UPI001CA80F2A|nr:uncharacterized protein LOC122526094 isoform X1 [Polistes fuscatus]
MSDETFAKTLIGDIPYADEDGYSIDQISHSRLVSKISTTNEKGNLRITQISRTARTIFLDKKENTKNDNNRTSSPKYIYSEKNANEHRSIGKKIDKFQNPNKTRSKHSQQQQQQLQLQQLQQQLQQQQLQPQQQQPQQQIQQQSGYSSSEESIIRNKSKSTSSADTQSVNNILDEYEDERIIELSDVGSTTCTMNLKSVKVEHPKKKQIQQPQQYHYNRQEIKRTICNNSFAHRKEKCESISKVNQQTQVRQRSRERGKDSTRYSSSALTSSRRASPLIVDNIDRIATSMPSSKANDDLPRKGEVQRRVDEWLSQAQLQSSASTSREKPLTRSNSSAERRSSQRRCQRSSQDPRSRSIDESTERANCGASSSYDDLTRTNPDPTSSSSSSNFVFNKETYKDYLLIKNKTRQQDYGFIASNGVNRRDISPNTSSKIPQRGSSFKRNESKNKKLSNSNYIDGLLSTNTSAVLSRKPSFTKSHRNDYIEASNITAPTEVSLIGKKKDDEDNSKGRIIQDERRINEEQRIAQINKDGESRVCSLAERLDKSSEDVVLCKSNLEIVKKNTMANSEAKGSLVSVQVRVPSQGHIDWRKINPNKAVAAAAATAPICSRKESSSSGSRVKNQCSMALNEESGSTRSTTFKPNETRNYAKSAAKLATKDNNATTNTMKYISTCSSSSNHVEKIYERSLEPQVIYADDLRSILRPSLRISAYGEREETREREEDDLEKGRREEKKGKDEKNEKEETEEDIYGRIGEMRQETLETIMEDDRKVEIVCGKGSVTLDDWKLIDEMNSIDTDEKSIDTRYRRFSSKQDQKEEKDIKNNIMEIDEGSSDPEDRLDNHDKLFSFENNGDEFAMRKFKVEEDTRQVRAMIEDDRSILSKENNEDRSSGMVVKESLLKNLQFDAGLPAKVERRSESKCGDQQANRSKLFDDRVQLVQRDERKGEDENKSPEEMEHFRLMDLLRNGDYEAIKLELERSSSRETLSSPVGNSPVCCQPCSPPCSPPPAPAAYISSARASSRRLTTGSGLGPLPSPERDPLGRLLRFLKTFYTELGKRDPPHMPAWVCPLPLGSLCPAHFKPHLQLVHKSEQEHRLENIKPDQIFAPVRLSDGTVSEAPRRVAVEGGPGSGRTTLCLRLLYQWAIQAEGPALAFIVPLRELRGSPLLNYLARELLPRTAALGDAVAQVWRTLHLMEDRVLFVLDGYDECVGGRASLGDAADLLEGRLFPEARILVTCSPINTATLSPLVQRRIHLAGLEWPHVERLCVAYFIHNNMAGRACEFLEALNVQPQPVKQLGQHPLGWIMLCCLYQDSGSLPRETSALMHAAVKCIVKRSLEPAIPYEEEIPGHCRKRLEEFGKVSLAALREGRCCYTEAEIRARGGGIEVTRLGFLTKGLTLGQRRKPDLFTPIHVAVAEFLAAYYLTSVAQYANILRRELEGLPSGIIGHLAGLLGPKTHLILNQLCPLEVPPRSVFSLLKAAGASDGNVSAVCRLVGAAGSGFGPAPNEKPSAPLVHTSPLELEGWSKILQSSACTLEALELVFQLERGFDTRYLDEFFDALATNESVKLVRITSLLGQEFPADEALRLAGHLKSVLGKKKLNDFELVITCLEESAHDKLECVVNVLCRGLSHASNSLARLVLDMNLSGEQVSRICDALRGCVQVQALHLPHLGCGSEGLASVAELLKERPLLALNLAGSWGSKNEDPSSSGISMGSGSGSGSSGYASSILGTLPLNRCYSSLPRGALAAYGSLTRPATLPRLPFGLGLGLGLGPTTAHGHGGGHGTGNATGPTGSPATVPASTANENAAASATGNAALPQNDSNGSSKRNSDSVLCHRPPLMHPLPTCDVANHQGTGFHEIFNAIREPSCKLRSLNVSKCLLGGLDAGCLGETIRKARHLDALRAAGASKPADVMPLVLALTEAPCLQLLDLASPRLALDDHPSRLLCQALARNTTLRLLSLEGWTFRIEESETLSVFSELLRYTNVRELSLCNARLHLAVHEGPLARLGRRDDAGAELLRAAPPPACPAIVFLRLAGFQVTVNDRLALRGPLLLPFLAGFTGLSELDLSLDKSAIGGSSGSLLFIDDKILQQFFACLSSHFRNLQSLRISFWRISLEDSERTMRQIAKYIKLCNLSFLKMNGLIVTDSAKKTQMEHVFIQTIIMNLQYLTWLCLDGIEITEKQASSIGKCTRDRYTGSCFEISAKDVNVKSVKAFVAAIEEGGKAEVVYTGGSNCRLKITMLQKSAKNKKK